MKLRSGGYGGYLEMSLTSWSDPQVSLQVTELDPGLPSGSRTASVGLSLHELQEFFREHGYELTKIVYEDNPVR